MMLTAPKWFIYLNAFLRFALEITALVVLGVWGWRISFALGIALPLVAAVVWGWFVAPKAKWYLPLPGRLAIEALIFGGATAALADMGKIWWAVGLAGLAVANSTLVHLNRDSERARLLA